MSSVRASNDAIDPELGPVRRCLSCGEWWPLDGTFFDINRRGRLRKCKACQAEARAHTTRSPKAERDRDYRRMRRYDPATRGAVLARQREAAKRYYWRHRAQELEKQRAWYAAQLDRPVRIGFGRPRAEVAA